MRVFVTFDDDNEQQLLSFLKENNVEISMPVKHSYWLIVDVDKDMIATLEERGYVIHPDFQMDVFGGCLGIDK